MALAFACGLLAQGCDIGSGDPDPERPSPESPAQARHLPGGRWNVEPIGTRPGRPFQTTVVRTLIEAKNITDEVIAPVCLLTYGTQTGIFQSNLELEPGERAMVDGSVRFPRPLDDYESAGAGCYTRLPTKVARSMEREQEALTMGRPTTVPRLIGRPLDSRLPSFRRGLVLEIAREGMPCGESRLEAMSRTWNPFGKPPCGNPVVSAQDLKPGTRAEVGQTISITVASRP